MLRKLPEGTLGKELSDCLDVSGLHLVPGYESHDLKHVVLDYKMTADDEIRMQAFMLGNGNYTLPCFIILLYGMILLPGLWPQLLSDFRRGYRTLPISSWTVEDYASEDLNYIRDKLKFCRHERRPITAKFTHHIALLTVIAGIFGMVFCLPFLFSSSLPDLVGAGFPFMAGAILVAGGLMAMSNLSKCSQLQNSN